MSSTHPRQQGLAATIAASAAEVTPGADVAFTLAADAADATFFLLGADQASAAAR